MRWQVFVLGVWVASACAGEPALLAPGVAPPVDEPGEGASLLDPGGRHAQLVLYWENDGTYAKPFDRTDRHYTNGFGFELGLAYPEGSESGPAFVWPDVFDARSSAIGVSVKQFMLTPENIAATALIPEDNPYAGWLTFGLFVQRSDEDGFDHLQLDLGVLGGDYTGAEGLQKFVHSAVPDQIKPAGWDNQLANELAANLTYQHRWRTPRVEFWGLEADAIPLAGLQAGTVHVNAEAGIIGRVGLNVPDDFGPRRLREFQDHTGNRGPDAISAYAWGRVGGQLVGRNALIEGNLFAASHGKNPKLAWGEAAGGLAVRWRWLEVAWSVTYMTEQTKGQADGDSYGSWSVNAHFDF